MATRGDDGGAKTPSRLPFLELMKEFPIHHDYIVAHPPSFMSEEHAISMICRKLVSEYAEPIMGNEAVVGFIVEEKDLEDARRAAQSISNDPFFKGMTFKHDFEPPGGYWKAWYLCFNIKW